MQEQNYFVFAVYIGNKLSAREHMREITSKPNTTYFVDANDFAALPAKAKILAEAIASEVDKNAICVGHPEGLLWLLLALPLIAYLLFETIRRIILEFYGDMLAARAAKREAARLERERLAAEKAERERLKRLEKERLAELERLRLEALAAAAAETARIAAEAEAARLAALAEKARLAAAAEAARLAALAAAEAARLAALAEKARLVAAVCVCVCVCV
jgi:hypothetical protein